MIEVVVLFYFRVQEVPFNLTRNTLSKAIYLKQILLHGYIHYLLQEHVSFYSHRIISIVICKPTIMYWPLGKTNCWLLPFQWTCRYERWHFVWYSRSLWTLCVMFYNCRFLLL